MPTEGATHDKAFEDGVPEISLQSVQKPLANIHPRNRNDGPPGLETFPWDVIEMISSYLKQSDFVRLSKTSRKLYQMVQPLLWRHPKISDHGPLTLFTNFLNRPPIITVPRVEDWDKVCWDRHTQVKQMTLRVDAGSGLNELASDLLHRVVKHCPQVQIKLFFNGKLGQHYLLQDPSAFFPGVTLIIISDTGLSPDPNEVISGRRATKGPQIAKYGSDFEEDMDQVVETMKREIKEDKKAVTLAAKVHPYLRLLSTEWEGMSDCVAYAVDLDVGCSQAGS